MKAENGANVISYLYLFFIIIVSQYVFWYINPNSIKENNIFNGMIILLIATFLGNYSRLFYERLILMIYAFDESAIPKKVIKTREVVSSLSITFTCYLLITFIIASLVGEISIIILIVINNVPIFMAMIALFYRLFGKAD